MGPRLPGGALLADCGETESRGSTCPDIGEGELAFDIEVLCRVGDVGDVPELATGFGPASFLPSELEEPDCGIDGRDEPSVEAELRRKFMFAKSSPSWTALYGDAARAGDICACIGDRYCCENPTGPAACGRRLFARAAVHGEGAGPCPNMGYPGGGGKPPTAPIGPARTPTILAMFCIAC